MTITITTIVSEFTSFKYEPLEAALLDKVGHSQPHIYSFCRLGAIVLLAGMVIAHLLGEVTIARSSRHVPDFILLNRFTKRWVLDLALCYLLLELFNLVLLR